VGTLFACLWFAGCGTPESTGGGATETGNGFAVRVRTSGGAAARAAAVEFVRTDSWIADLADLGTPRTFQAVADMDGVVRLDSLPPGLWAVQGEWNGQMGIVPVTATDSSTVLQLDTEADLRGSLAGDSTSAVWVEGTGWHSSVHGGEFHLFVAPGQIPLVASSGGYVVPLGVPDPGPGTSQALLDTVQRHRIVVEDFSEGNHASTISHFIGLGTWYTTSDSGTQIVLNLQGELNLQYVSKDTSIGYATAGIVFADKVGYHDLDLASMDSLCFDQRGVGQNTVLFEHIVNGANANQGVVSAGNLTASWTHFCVTPSAMKNSWDSMSTTTNNISFCSTHGSRLEMRNIALWGVALQAILP
jgi:hypothetical protein